MTAAVDDHEDLQEDVSEPVSLDRTEYELTIHLESYIAQPYWPEKNQVIEIEKKSGFRMGGGGRETPPGSKSSRRIWPKSKCRWRISAGLKPARPVPGGACGTTTRARS